MGTIASPEMALLFTAVFSNDEAIIEETIRKLQTVWAPEIGRSERFEFECTSYYEQEMGKSLKKQIVLFDKIIDPSTISHIKNETNEIESKISNENKRIINIDPGYITLSKTVLATTKNYTHRIYLGNGIYAEITLNWHKGTFQPLSWTYPDYKKESVIHFLNTGRNILKQMTRS